MTKSANTGMPGAAKAALLGGTALAVVMALGAPAQAQGTAEMEAKIQSLEAENAIMKNEMQEMRQQLDALADQAPSKPAKMVTSGDEDVSLKISGQVNRAVLVGDDGSGRTFVRNVDNDNSSTRIRFDAAGKVDDDLTIKSRIEVELQINPSDGSVSDAGSGLATDFGGPGGFGARKAYVALASKTFGELTLGQESVATDGVVEQDLSGTSVVMNGEAEDFAGGINLTNAATGFSIGDSINDSFDNFDGAGQFADRQNVVRYETPKLVGFQLIGSYGNDGSDGNAESMDLALHYGGEFFDTEVEAGIGYSHVDADVGFSSAAGAPNQNFIGGSVGLLHQPTGLNVHYAQGKVSFAGDRGALGDIQPGPSFWYVKAGWKEKIWSMGTTAISIDYGEYMNDDGVAGAGGNHDNFGRAYGVALVQKIDKAATELYAGVKRFEFHTAAGDTDVQGNPVTGVEPVIAGLVGARIKF